jgi:hypothetical protein
MATLGNFVEVGEMIRIENGMNHYKSVKVGGQEFKVSLSHILIHIQCSIAWKLCSTAEIG